MDNVVAVIIGLLSSLSASALFLLILSRYKPKIELCKYIAKTQGPDGKNFYQIKFVNKTRRSLRDVKTQLHLITPAIVPGGTTQWAEKKISMGAEEIMTIPKYDPKDNEVAGYATRLRTGEDLEQIWGDDTRSFLRFTIFAIDSRSGFGQDFVQEYRIKRDAIREGDFEFGSSLDIK